MNSERTDETVFYLKVKSGIHMFVLSGIMVDPITKNQFPQHLSILLTSNNFLDCLYLFFKLFGF